MKRILEYLNGTNDVCLWYPKGESIGLIGYTDAEFAGFIVDRKRTSAIAHFLGPCLVSWWVKET